MEFLRLRRIPLTERKCFSDALDIIPQVSICPPDLYLMIIFSFAFVKISNLICDITFHF